MIGGKQTCGPSPGERDQKEHEGSPKVFSQNGHGAMIFQFFCSRGRSHSCSHPRSTNYCVCDGECTHTHLLHVHFLVYIHCAYTSHILMRVTHMHGSRVSAVRMSCLPWLNFSLLMFHPSLLMSSLLFLDGHFETTPDCDLTDFDVHDFPHNVPDLEAQVKCTPHEDELFGYLQRAVWLSGQVRLQQEVMSPRRSTRSHLWTMTRRSLTILTTISTTFRKSRQRLVCREPRREVGMPRNTREDMRYSWERFWLSTCSTRSWWITRWFKEFGDIIGHSENRRNWGKWERRTIAVNTFILFLGKSKTKKSGRWIASFVYD